MFNEKKKLRRLVVGLMIAVSATVGTVALAAPASACSLYMCR